MRWEEWLAADPARQPEESHRRYGIGWSTEDPIGGYELRWVPGTGEIVAVGVDGDVEVLGAVPDGERVNGALAGWEQAAGAPGSLYWARATLAEHHQRLQQARHEPPAAADERRRGARYQLDEPDGTWWELGWDRPLATYYAQHLYQDPIDGPDVGEWFGASWAELPDVDALEAIVGRPLDDTRATLEADRTAFPAPDPPPVASGNDDPPEELPGAGVPAPPIDPGSVEANPATRPALGDDMVGWVDDGPPGRSPLRRPVHSEPSPFDGRLDGSLAPARWDRSITSRADHGIEVNGPQYFPDLAFSAARVGRADAAGLTVDDLSAWAAELDDRQTALDHRAGQLARQQRRLAAQAAALQAAGPVEARWSLPAGPVAEVIAGVQDGTGEDVATVARGLGLDPRWMEAVLDGRIDEVDLPHVAQVCEGLHCSPYDLWGDETAAGILHAYPPGLWPRFIEPLHPADHLPESPDPGLSGPDLGP